MVRLAFGCLRRKPDDKHADAINSALSPSLRSLGSMLSHASEIVDDEPRDPSSRSLRLLRAGCFRRAAATDHWLRIRHRGRIYRCLFLSGARPRVCERSNRKRCLLWGFCVWRRLGTSSTPSSSHRGLHSRCRDCKSRWCSVAKTRISRDAYLSGFRAYGIIATDSCREVSSRRLDRADHFVCSGHPKQQFERDWSMVVQFGYDHGQSSDRDRRAGPLAVEPKSGRQSRQGDHTRACLLVISGRRGCRRRLYSPRRESCSCALYRCGWCWNYPHMERAQATIIWPCQPCPGLTSDGLKVPSIDIPHRRTARIAAICQPLGSTRQWA